MAQPDKHHPTRSGAAFTHHMAMRAAPCGAPAEQDSGPNHVPEITVAVAKHRLKARYAGQHQRDATTAQTQSQAAAASTQATHTYACQIHEQAARYDTPASTGAIPNTHKSATQRRIPPLYYAIFAMHKTTLRLPTEAHTNCALRT
jgi:hypothetical protein